MDRSSPPPDEPSAPPLADLNDTEEETDQVERDLYCSSQSSAEGSPNGPNPSTSRVRQQIVSSKTLAQHVNEFEANDHQPLKPQTWVYDASSPIHKCGSLAWFCHFETDGKSISLQDAYSKKITYGIGNVMVLAKTTTGGYIDFVLKNVQYVPDCDNVVSKVGLENQQCIVQINNNVINVKTPDNQDILDSVKYMKGHVMLFEPLPNNNEDTITTKLNLGDNCKLWHQRLLHYQCDILSASKSILTGITGCIKDDNISCDSCIQNSVPNHWMPSISTRADTRFQKCDVINGVLLDLENPNSSIKYKPKTFQDPNCVIMFEDKCTSFIWAVSLFKTELAEKTVKFIRKMSSKLENLPSGKYRQLRLSQDFQDIIPGFHRTVSEKTLRYGFECETQLVDEETKYRNKLIDIFTKNQMILKYVGLPPKLWHMTLDTVVFLENALVKGSLNETTSSFYKFKEKKPTATNLRIIGSPCWAKKTKPRLDKGESPYTVCFMLGYNNEKKSFNFWYKFLESNDRQFTTTNFVCFEEACLLDLRRTFSKVIRPAPAPTVSIYTDQKKFKDMYESLKTIDNYNQSAFRTKLVKEGNNFYESFLDKCRQEPFVPPKKPIHLEKITDLDRFELPLSRQLENFKLKDKKLDKKQLYLDENDNGSVFTMISCAIFGTPLYSTCLRVVFIRHCVEYWEFLEQNCPAMYNDTIENVIHSAMDSDSSRLEPILEAFSFLFKYPIYFTTVEDKPGTKHYTYVFLQDESFAVNCHVWLVHWNNKLLVRLRKERKDITGFDPSDATRWGTRVTKYGTVRQVRHDPIRLMLPVIDRPHFLNQDLFNHARDVVSQTNRMTFNRPGVNPAIATAENHNSIAKIATPFVTSLLNELKKQSEDNESSSGTKKNNFGKKRCSTCVDSDSTNKKLRLKLEKILKENKKLQKENEKIRSRIRIEEPESSHEIPGPSSLIRQQQPQAISTSRNEPQAHASTRGYSGRLRQRSQTATTSNQSTSVVPQAGALPEASGGQADQDQHVPATYDEYCKQCKAKGKKARSYHEYVDLFNDQGGHVRRAPEEPMHTCRVLNCSRKFLTWELMLRHLDDFHSRTVPEIIHTSDEDDDGRFGCPYCTKTFVSETTLKTHVRRFHDPNSETQGFFECPYCDIIFKGRKCRDSHVLMKHKMNAKPNDQEDSSEQDEADNDQPRRKKMQKKKKDSKK